MRQCQQSALVVGIGESLSFLAPIVIIRFLDAPPAKLKTLKTPSRSLTADSLDEGSR